MRVKYDKSDMKTNKEDVIKMCITSYKKLAFIKHKYSVDEPMGCTELKKSLFFPVLKRGQKIVILECL